MWKRIIVVAVLTVASICGMLQQQARAQTDPFPLPDCIQPNVSFWTQIYTRYSSDEGVIHDKHHLDRIYGVIKLADAYSPGGRRINRKRINRAKKQYKAVLAGLMRGRAPSNSLERRVAGMFGPDAGAAQFRAAMRNLRCQVGQKDRFREGLVRSGAYIDAIRAVFREAGLPEDLAYLPHVESSFNPKAYSKFGAAGIWQFTRSTGKYYMRVGYAIDERRDPLRSSRAAAKLLRQNYRRLQDWPLAITAYNHGTAGMLRALRSRGSYEAIFKSYRSRIFKFASRNFYSEFLAARQAAKNYRQYFGDLKLDTPVRSREMVLTGYVSLPEVARHLHLELADLRRLNPALRHPVLQGRKYVPPGYSLRLPYQDDENWQTLIAGLPQKLYKHSQKHSHIYTVQRGDTAGKIAQRHGVRLRDLIAANNLDRRATVYVQQTLRIPAAGYQLPKAPPSRSVATSVTARAAQTGSQPPAGRGGDSYIAYVDPLMGVWPAPESKMSGAAVVASGCPGSSSTLPAKIMLASADNSRYWSRNSMLAAEKQEAKTVGSNPVPAGYSSVRISATADLEPEKDNSGGGAPTVRTGSPFQPVVYAPRVKPAEVVLGNYGVERVWCQEGKTFGLIRVEVEETLGHYADWLGVSARQLRRLNGLRYGRILHLNQKIKIPLFRVGKEAFEEKRFEYHQQLAEDFFASYRVEKVLTYRVKRGDNIWTLSRREFELPLWLIKHYNADVDFNALIPSQKLLIPVVEKNV